MKYIALLSCILLVGCYSEADTGQPAGIAEQITGGEIQYTDVEGMVSEEVVVPTMEELYEEVIEAVEPVATTIEEVTGTITNTTELQPAQEAGSAAESIDGASDEPVIDEGIEEVEEAVEEAGIDDVLDTGKALVEGCDVTALHECTP